MQVGGVECAGGWGGVCRWVEWSGREGGVECAGGWGGNLALRTHKSTHVLHNPQHWQSNLPTETDLLTNIQQSNFLYNRSNRYQHG